MGTKIEHSINPLAVAVESNNFSISGVDVWEYYQKKRLTGINNKSKDPISMDRILDRNSMESIKKTMQMQEDIFKHQVRELHRVYSVQKMLMEELKKESRQKNIWTAMSGLEISLPSNRLSDQQQHQRRTQNSYGPDFQVQSLREDYYSRERSGSCSGGDKMPQRGFDLARPAEENEGEAGPSSYTAFQSCKIRNDGDDDDMEVDLTLSIGGSGCSQGKKKKEKNHLLYSSASFKSERGEECSDPNTPMSSSSVTFDQERRGGIHWFSQDLRFK
ncbi:uncharacterized protein LOC114730718 isoform X2 [Neltuma alba]|nr:uncharacterized protein LOC114730718 isoform X2 [Prosopis alba]